MDKCGRCGATDGVCLYVPGTITKMDEQENGMLMLYSKDDCIIMSLCSL